MWAVEPGVLLPLLHDKAGQVVVADPSLGMLRFASSKPGIQVIAACSENLPFPDEFLSAGDHG